MDQTTLDSPSKQGHTEITQDDFSLHKFFPYLVRVYYRAVSGSVSRVYGSQFDLSVSEWRTMAVLGPYGVLSATEIVDRSSIDKVNVSRAIKGLQKRGYLKRDIDGEDKRKAVLRLTDEGRRTYIQLIPMIKALESQLLEGMSHEEVCTLIRLMAQVQKNAEKAFLDPGQINMEARSIADLASD